MYGSMHLLPNTWLLVISPKPKVARDDRGRARGPSVKSAHAIEVDSPRHRYTRHLHRIIVLLAATRPGSCFRQSGQHEDCPFLALVLIHLVTHLTWNTCPQTSLLLAPRLVRASKHIAQVVGSPGFGALPSRREGGPTIASVGDSGAEPQAPLPRAAKGLWRGESVSETFDNRDVFRNLWGISGHGRGLGL